MALTGILTILKLGPKRSKIIISKVSNKLMGRYFVQPPYSDNRLSPSLLLALTATTSFSSKPQSETIRIGFLAIRKNTIEKQKNSFQHQLYTEV